MNLEGKNLRVGVFEVQRGAEVDLEKGILPPDWADDPRLSDMMEKHFHILDIRGMKSNGLNMDSDRILIFHENAGEDIIKWK